MIDFKSVDLYEYFSLERKYNGGTLNYCLHSDGKMRPLMLVIAGGAYEFLCFRENKPIANRFYENGYNVFYLDYSCGKGVEYPTALNETVMAVSYIREKYNEKLGIIGFSAGGHLVGQVSNDDIDAGFLGERKKYFVQPDAVIYCYPVISTRKGLIHEDSFRNLLKSKYGEYIKKVSVEKMINGKSAPAFIFHCADDALVPVGNSLALATEYKTNGVPFELHIFPKGGHGVALPTEECWTKAEILEYGVDSKMIIWFDLCLAWLKNNGIERGKVYEDC